MVLNGARNWDKSYAEECEINSETRVVLTDEKSPQVRW